MSRNVPKTLTFSTRLSAKLFLTENEFYLNENKIVRGFNLHLYGKRQTANVTFNFRISQNRKLEDKNSSQQFLRIKYYVKLLIYV